MAEKKSLILRIDPKIWNALNEWADDDLRSLNGQIEYVLREAIKSRKGSRFFNSLSGAEKKIVIDSNNIHKNDTESNEY